jgi:predicted permease
MAERSAPLSSIISVLTDPVLPIFAIAIIGYLLGRTGHATEENARIVNRFCMSIPMPVLVFGLLARSDFYAFVWDKLLVYAAGEAIVFTLVFLTARKVFACTVTEAVLLGVCGAFSNTVMYILPISQLVYGVDAVGPVVSVIVLDILFLFAGSLIFLELHGNEAWRPGVIVGKLARMPLIVAIVLGLATGLMGLDLPGPAETFINFNGDAAPPIALFALGVVLSKTRMSADPVVLTVGAIKMLAFPSGRYFPWSRPAGTRRRSNSFSPRPALQGPWRSAWRFSTTCAPTGSRRSSSAPAR